MKFRIDHDLHIHSLVSPCSADSRQTKEAILAYGLTNGFSLVGLSDHYWPDTREKAWVSLGEVPRSEGCRFLKGMEVDMDMHGNLLLTPEEMERLDYFLISLTHLHLVGYVTPEDAIPATAEQTAEIVKKRLRALLQMDLPFARMGLAHLTFIPQPKGVHLTECLACFSVAEWEDLFSQLAKRGMGIELNFDLDHYTPSQQEQVLLPYRIAKRMGCQFYLGGDAHHPEGFIKTRTRFEKIVEALALTEDNKWELVKQNRK